MSKVNPDIMSFRHNEVNFEGTYDDSPPPPPKKMFEHEICYWVILMTLYVA